MAIIASETWTGTNGAAWPSQWTIPPATTSGTATIQSNSGQIAISNGSGYAGSIVLTGLSPTPNEDMTITFAAAASGVEQYVYMIVNQDFSTVDGSGFSINSVHFEINYNATAASSTIALVQGNNSSQNTTFGMVTRTLTGGVAYQARVQLFGTAVVAKLWQLGNAEPAAWDIMGTLATYPAGGTIGLAVHNGAAAAGRTFTFNNLVVSDVAVPMAWLRL